MDVASHCGPLGLALDFLDDDTSWNLFCQKAFAQESYPLELELIGKEIVRKCRGLPLSISVIGGLLGNSSKMPEKWNEVAKDFRSILNKANDNECLNVLSLSYDYLPSYLKPCFLYLGIFPEDISIGVSRLINLWIAEGFLKPQKEQCLEEVAYGYFKDLVDRNLIIVRCLTSSSEKVKICHIHDLVRDLCLKVAEKEKFFCILQKTYRPHIDLERRIIINENIWSNMYPILLGNAMKSASLARSFIGKFKFTGPLKSRLLRVLSPYYGDPFDTTSKPINLRFLDYHYSGNDHGPCMLPLSISLFWNLQTLIITDVDRVDNIVAPSEIWEMPQLRHLLCSAYLPDPPLSETKDYIVLQNMQTLEIKLSFRFREDVCMRIPNIKKLNIFCHDKLGEKNILSNYSLHNIGSFKKLESLRLSYLEVNKDELLKYFKFPTSLKKLHLNNCQLHWDDLTILIGSLPHLEVLHLYSVEGHEWRPIEGEFLCLKSLGIGRSELSYWNADSTHFPVLEKLILIDLINLSEIPSSIGGIPTLQDIRVYKCSKSVAISAIEILGEQESLDNHCLQVRVTYSDKDAKDLKNYGGFTSPNLQISRSYFG